MYAVHYFYERFRVNFALSCEGGKAGVFESDPLRPTHLFVSPSSSQSVAYLNNDLSNEEIYI